MVELRAGESHIDLVDVASPEGAWARPEVAGGRNVDHIALRLASHDPQAAKSYLEARGVAIVEERTEPHSTSYYVKDPSGNTIELLVTLQTSG